MRVYLEASELVVEPVEPEFIRIDITDKTEAEIEAIQLDIKAIMEGKQYQLVKHQCHHDTGELCEADNII